MRCVKYTHRWGELSTSEHIPHYLIPTPQFTLLREIGDPFPLCLFQYAKVASHKIEEDTWNQRYRSTMLRVIPSAVDIKHEASHIADQHNQATHIYQFAQELQMRLDDTHAKDLCRLLVAAITLLLSQVAGSDALHMVEYIQ